MQQPQNRVLAAFGEDLALVRPYLRTVALHAGQVLREPGDEIRPIYFLHEGVVSKLTVFEDGGEVECALVGRDGALGGMATIGLRTAITRDVCHMDVTAEVLDARWLTEAAGASPLIQAAMNRYCAWMLGYSMRNGACNARHSVEPRLARWLLICADMLEREEIRLPQEVFAKMLGVQRSSVNTILQKFRGRGLIDLSRARLLIVDRAGLRAQACECYEALHEAHAAARDYGRPADARSHTVN